jgi:hypothetical protein
LLRSSSAARCTGWRSGPAWNAPAGASGETRTPGSGAVPIWRRATGTVGIVYSAQSGFIGAERVGTLNPFFREK